MVDIEHKTLEILKMHVNDLGYLLNNFEMLRSLVFDELTNVDGWNPVAREVSYNELAVLILRSGKINEIAESLIIMNISDKTSEERLVLTAISAFNNFFNKVYELYLLDQILYILSNISLEDLEGMVIPVQGLVTNNYNMEGCFGLEERQTMLYDFYYEETYRKLLGLKMEYQARINSLIRKEEMKRKYDLLNQKLKELAFSDNPSFYANRIYIALNTLISEPAQIRKRIRKVDSDQLSFF